MFPSQGDFRQVTWVTRGAYLMAGGARGVIGNGVGDFLLIYYSQALGLEPSLAGLALLISLCVDAVTDPVVGRWSDGIQTRWGRRHPFIYASIMPVSVFFFALWYPPELGQTGLFLYLTTMAIAMRVAFTPFTVPFSAMVPDITSDYDERTTLFNYSVSGAYFFGTLISVGMLGYWLADPAGQDPGSGFLVVEGYVESGAVGAIAIFFFLTLAALGTHNHIPYLRQPPPRNVSLSRVFTELRETLNERALIVMLVAGVFSAAAGGTGTALWAYIQSYFWEFTSTQNSVLAATQLLSAAITLTCLKYVTRQREKKRALIELILAAIITTTVPIFLRQYGWFPANGDPALFYTMMVFGIAWIASLVMVAVVTASTITDLVEAREIATGRREEGVLLAVNSFIEKVSGGIGAWAGGTALAIISFPLSVDSSSVPAEAATNLGWAYAVLLTTLYGGAIIALLFFNHGREQHERNLQLLNKAR